MKLFLVRHGDYISETINPEKPLSDKGKADINKVGEKLKDAGYFVDEIFHSGKKRAEETAQILASYVLKTEKISAQKGMDPNDDPKTWLEKINAYNGDLMLVGHLPFMEKMSGFLLTGDESKVVIEFYQGTAAVLENTQKSNWKLINIVQP